MMHYDEFFGTYGGRYVAEVLQAPLVELEEAYRQIETDETFQSQFDSLASSFIGRPTPLMHAENLSAVNGGAQIYVKMEGLANTGAHKINNAVGQALLASKMGKKRIIAETGAGQHGVATASICAKLGLDCTVYMGETDIRRQRPNVFWMELFGANVVPVTTGAMTLKDAINEALRDWSANFKNTYYLLGSALGPSPYPSMVKRFQSIIGKETVEQMKKDGIVPDAMVACVGGGSNAIGFFSPFIDQDFPRLIGAEAGGRGTAEGEHASRMTGFGKTGIVHGYKSKFLLNEDGQVLPTHSISAGLDYPGIGPELAWLGENNRIEFVRVSDYDAVEALRLFAKHEGVVFALESAHAAAAALTIAKTMDKDRTVVVHMSGRGDKDLFITAANLDAGPWQQFLSEEASRIRESSGMDISDSERTRTAIAVGGRKNGDE
jgi:tryptophan synthase beta chain